MLEEAINSVGVNTDEKKYLKLGVNTDAQSWFLEELGKYEWDGPKVQFDANQLMDFYDKMINEHPLLEYIEDCFALNDLKNHQKYLAKVKVSGKVSLGINSLFKSNLEKIKEYTAIV